MPARSAASDSCRHTSPPRRTGPTSWEPEYTLPSLRPVSGTFYHSNKTSNEDSNEHMLCYKPHPHKSFSLPDSSAILPLLHHCCFLVSDVCSDFTLSAFSSGALFCSLALPHSRCVSPVLTVFLPKEEAPRRHDVFCFSCAVFNIVSQESRNVFSTL